MATRPRRWTEASYATRPRRAAERRPVSSQRRERDAPFGGWTRLESATSSVSRNGRITVSRISSTTSPSPPMCCHETTSESGSTRLDAMHSSYSVSWRPEQHTLDAMHSSHSVSQSNTHWTRCTAHTQSTRATHIGRDAQLTLSQPEQHTLDVMHSSHSVSQSNTHWT